MTPLLNLQISQKIPSALTGWSRGCSRESSRKAGKRSRPQCIIAQAAPEEKAIVLRDTKESADSFIRKIKVDDIYGADAVRVENGVVKIKVGDLTSRGK